MDPGSLVYEDCRRKIFRVHRSAFTSPELLELERKNIFDKCWLYLGHESEVEKPGDFRRRTVGGRPLFWVRGSDGKVRVFHNTCTHWGAYLCRLEEGNAEVFQCFYHGWTFNNRGELISVPDDTGYSEGFDKSEMGLVAPPRVESYRGLYFVSFDPDVEDLVTYLAGAKEYIDLILDQSEEGWRVVPGTQKYGVRANWKLFSINSLDSYHVQPLHVTFFKYTEGLGPGDPPPAAPKSFPEAYGRSLALGNGHGVDLFAAGERARPIAHWHPILGNETRDEIHETRARLVQHFGEERAYLMCNTNRLLLIYPNFALHDIAGISLRYFEPVGPDSMEVAVRTLAPKNESPRLLSRRLENFLSFLGPGGFAHPDDIEAMESAQMGFKAGGPQWIDASRGMHRQATAKDELHVRSFWRQWRANLMGLRKAERFHDLADEATPYSTARK
jgi:p-cumate 2,3-dioxygenase alpha subunit